MELEQELGGHLRPSIDSLVAGLEDFWGALRRVQCGSGTSEG
jgi:hypothetical protein